MSRHRSSSSTRSRAQRAVWWIGEGDESCPHCEQTYSYEIEARCTRCDAAICLHCVTRRGKAVLCPECTPPGG